MADLIDRKSVIDVIHKAIFDFFDMGDDDDESPMTYKDEQLLTLNKAIVTKIKALPSAQPDLQPTCNQLATDCISRQAAYEVLTAYYHQTTDIQHAALHEALNKVPSADIDLSGFSDKLWAAAYERGKAEAVPSARARWEYVDYGGFGNWHCSACRAISPKKYNFCPACGRDMRGDYQ